MLEKILNINPQDKYKSGLKIPTGNLYVHANEYNQHKRKDSALFSPLAKFLSKINWQILNIEYPSEEEVFFNFLVDDVEFIALINLSEIYTELYQEFSIYKSLIRENKKQNFEIKLNVSKEEISILETPEPISISSINRLFERVAESSPLFNIDPHSTSELLFGIDNEMKHELNYIMKVMYTFLSTKFKSKIKNNFILKTESNFAIMIRKIDLTIAE